MSTRIILKRSLVFASATSVAALIAAGCAQSPGAPSAPQQTPVANGAQRSIQALGGTTSSTPVAGEIIVCKQGNVNGTFAVAIASELGAGSGTLVSPVTVTPSQCVEVAADSSGSGSGTNFTVTETSAGLQSVSAVINGGNPVPFTNGVTQLFVNSFHGYTITFVNNVVVSTGLQGCTPGFWKQPQHVDDWPAGFKPTDSFDATFGIGTNWFPSTFTLEDALSQGGGGFKALGRQAVAALLSAKSGFYPLTVAQVIAKVQAAYANASIIDSTQNELAADNNLGCPLS